MTQILGKAEVSLKDIETDLLLLRRTLRSTNVDLQVRVPLRSENYIPGVAGWNFDLDGNAELNNVTVRGTIEANGVFAGSLDAATVNAINLTASQITSGTLAAVRIPNLSADKITSGTFSPVRIPNLSTDKITSGTFDPVRIPNLSANKITTGTLNANNVTISGTLSAVTLSGVGGSFSGSLTAGVTQANALRTASITSPSGTNISIVGVGSSLGMSASGNITLFPVGQLRFSAGDEIQFNTNVYYRANPTVSGLTANVHMGTSNGLLRRITSSIRYKKNVRDAGKLPNLLDLRTVYFKAKNPLQGEDDPNEEHYGVIAEEADALGLSDLVVYNEDSQPESVAFSHFGIALIPYVRDLEERVSALEDANG